MWSDIISGEKDAVVAAEDAPEIEGYDILEEIGNGGMGIVYRARQHQPEREVALKIIAPYSLRAALARARFMIEVEAMAAVEHPTMLPLYDTGEDEYGRPWLTMQLAHGGTLGERTDRFSEKWREIARLLVKLCQAIHFAHERGILHRDLKPANILFDKEDNPYIADFGLAKWADDDSSITKSTYLLGSPAYLAPETAAGGSKRSTTVSDVYGLGAILYELLCGKKPYEGTQAAEVLTQILKDTLISPRAKLSKIPRDLDVIVMKAMASEPGKRYHSASAFADDLNRWLEGRAIQARPVGSVERMLNWARRNPALTTLSLLLLTSLITGGILLWKSNQELTVALDDAENRVDFMTRELPPRLEPLGRLDLLDDVFENVSEHYAMDNRTDSQSLSRHADFLTQWAQILRPRGKIKESIDRLEQAMVKAEAATQVKPASLEASRSLVATGRRLGEALIEDLQFDEARTILASTIAFSEQAAKDHPDDLLLAQHIAKLVLERAILELEADEPEQALIYGEQAMKLWEKITPEMLTHPDSPLNQQALITATMGHFTLSKIHNKLSDSYNEAAQLKNYLTAAEKLMLLSPANLHFRHEHVIARQVMLKHQLQNDDMTLDESLEKFQKLDSDIVFLTTQEPGNVRWHTDSVTIAFRMHEIATRQNDEDSANRFLNIISQRLEPLYKAEPNDIRFLYSHRAASAQCAFLYLETDWPKAKYHFNQLSNIQLRICRLVPNITSHISLLKGTRKIAIDYQKREGTPQAMEWLISRAEVYNQKAKLYQPGIAAYWKWSEAKCYALIPEIFKDSPALLTTDHVRKWFSLLIEIADHSTPLPEYSKDVYSASLAYLNLLNNETDDLLKALTQLLRIMPVLRDSGGKTVDSDSEEKWLELIILNIQKIPKVKRQAIIDQSLNEFFSEPDSDSNKASPYYKQLQQLR